MLSLSSFSPWDLSLSFSSPPPPPLSLSLSLLLSLSLQMENVTFFTGLCFDIEGVKRCTKGVPFSQRIDHLFGSRRTAREGVGGGGAVSDL